MSPPAGFDQPAPKLLQPRLDHIVIIVAARIDRNAAARALLEHRERIVVRTVIDAEHDDRAHFGPQRARIAAPFGVGRHPFHVAVSAGGEKLAQPFADLRNRIRMRHADGVETLRAGGVGERGFEIGRRQKSRLA